MAVPTEQQLDDAFRDLNDLESIVNGDSSTVVATRTGGNKPTVSKVVGDALASEILNGGAGLAMQTAVAYFTNDNANDKVLAALPELQAGSYFFRGYMPGVTGSSSTSPDGRIDLALGFRFAESAAQSVHYAMFTARVYNSSNNLAFHASDYNFPTALIATPIDLQQGDRDAMNISIEGQFKLLNPVQPSLVGYRVSGGHSSADFTQTLNDGVFEVIKVA